MSTLTSVDNATTVAKMYEAFKKGYIATIIGQVTDNCKWIGTGEGSLPQGGSYTGKDAVNFFKRLNDSVEFTEFNPVAIHDINENEVASFGNMTGISRATGKKAYSEWAMHFKFNEDGKLIYFHDFFDTAAAYIANQQ